LKIFISLYIFWTALISRISERVLWCMQSGRSDICKMLALESVLK
jgi:hypothetical protein